jgi:hypothetical protein
MKAKMIPSILLLLVLLQSECVGWRIGSTPSATPAQPTGLPTGLPAPITPTIQIETASPPTPVAVPALIIDYNHSQPAWNGLFGVNGWWSDQDAGLWKSRYQELGIQLVRIPAPQGLFEPENDDGDPNHINAGGFHFNTPIPWADRTLTLGQWLSAMNDLGVTVMIYIPTLAGWLSANGDAGLISTYPPNNLAEYGEYVGALLRFAVQEVGLPPERLILEPVNEPDLDCGADPAVPCFWKAWKMQDLVNVLKEAHRQARAVNPAIRVVGPAECCQPLADQLIANYDGKSYLDGLSYHQYVSGSDFSAGLERGRNLQNHGLPVFLDEYGNTTVWSEGAPGALWHASVLPQIWAAGIQPVEYPVSDFPNIHAGYNRLGLFLDWRGNWSIKPAYYVYQSFYRLIAPGQMLAIGASDPNLLAASRSRVDTPRLAIWLVNPDMSAINLAIDILHFPIPYSRLRIIDNLSGTDAEPPRSLAGAPLHIQVEAPPQSSYTLLIEDSSHSDFFPFGQK